MGIAVCWRDLCHISLFYGSWSVVFHVCFPFLNSHSLLISFFIHYWHDLCFVSLFFTTRNLVFRIRFPSFNSHHLSVSFFLHFPSRVLHLLTRRFSPSQVHSQGAHQTPGGPHHHHGHRSPVLPVPHQEPLPYCQAGRGNARSATFLMPLSSSCLGHHLLSLVSVFLPIICSVPTLYLFLFIYFYLFLSPSVACLNFPGNYLFTSYFTFISLSLASF